MKRHHHSPGHRISTESLSFIEVQVSDDDEDGAEPVTSLLSVEARICAIEPLPNSRLARTFAYFALGFTAFLPVIHLLIFVDEQVLYQRTILEPYRNLTVLNSLGGIFYATRIPGRFYRNIFDVYGSSHQVMHVMVICGALLYQTGLLTTRQYWRNYRVEGLVCPAV